MISGSWARFAPLSGLLFVALVVASFIVGGDDAPDTDAPTVEVVSYWIANDSDQIAAAILSALAAVALLRFARLAAERVPDGGGRNRTALDDRLRGRHRAGRRCGRGRVAPVRGCQQRR